MYSDKENINILTAALVQYGVSQAVVCPGSRNAPIVHNLHEHPAIVCHPVTDERSAGFYALGISLATNMSPVVVCVTSGSALLNLAPAVAEAHYQHVPLIVVSADRPERWIGQLDGQTLPQPEAFGSMVRKTVQLPEPRDEEEQWHCRRLVCEALHVATLHSSAPVHINVPISEPLFSFTTATLPDVHPYHRYRPFLSLSAVPRLPKALLNSRRLMVVIGQTLPNITLDIIVDELYHIAAVLREALGGEATNVDEALARTADKTALRPDYVLYIGDTVVSKRLKAFLRECDAPTAIITLDASCTPDPTMHLSDLIECYNTEEMEAILEKLCDDFQKCYSGGRDCPEHDLYVARESFAMRWNDLLSDARISAKDFEPRYSQMSAVRYFEQQLDSMEYEWQVHYANSSAIRLANIYAKHHVWCNRGVNGIEGSMSTAAGFSLATSDVVFLVIGDLSFFYDQNALWNSEIGANLRIILLNNGGGGIFRSVAGLPESGAPMALVAGQHSIDARGICFQNDIEYIDAHDQDEMRQGITRLLTKSNTRPVVIEIFTDSEIDAAELRRYTRQSMTL